MRKIIGYPYVQFALFATINIAFWFRDYFVHGYMFLEEAGQMLWADWLMARHLVVNSSPLSQWNPYVCFGVDYIGREAFLSPVNLGTLVGFLFRNPKTAFVWVTMLSLFLMSLALFIYLRHLHIEMPYPLFGVAIFLLASKWVDDGYHGPHFVTGYIFYPVLLLTIDHIRETHFRKFRYYLLCAVVMSLIYLSLGASFLMMSSYFFLTYGIYVIAAYLQDNKVTFRGSISLFIPVFLYSGIALICFLGLSAYIVLPFWQNFSFSERSLFGEPSGYVGAQYLGFIFPWINRLYSPVVYDLPYPVFLPLLYPNMYFYTGILTVPALLYVLLNRRWVRPITFFAVYPLAILVLWNRTVIDYFPIFSFLERLTRGQASENFIHVTFIISFAVVVSWTLMELSRQGMVFVTDWMKRVWMGTVRLLSRLYLVAAAAIVLGFMLLHSPLRELYWHLLLNKHYLILDHYFGTVGLLLLSAFLVRALLLMLFHKGSLVKKPLLWVALILVCVDLQICFRLWYPFTDLDKRYDAQLPQNDFVLQKVQPLDRIAAVHYQLMYRASELVNFLDQKPTGTRQGLVDGFHGIYQEGFIEPVYEPGSNFFPLTVSKSLYAFHESLMPSYFWDYDVAMNSPNPKYQRQSWIGLWNPSSKLLDVAGVNYIFWSGPLEDPRLEEVERHACGTKFSCYVYRNKNALPRAFLAKRVEQYSSRKALLSRLQEVDFDPREAVTTEDQTLSDKFQASADRHSEEGEVQFEEYQPNEVRLATVSNLENVLVLNDMYYPGWKAYVDGAPETIHRVNGVFRGVLVPAGRHRVEFRYQNDYFVRGRQISLISWAGVLLFLMNDLLRSHWEKLKRSGFRSSAQ